MLMADEYATLGPTPQNSFKGSNFSGVPQPKLWNDSKAHDYSTDQSSSPNEKLHILITAGAFIAVAYVVWHVLYER